MYTYIRPYTRVPVEALVPRMDHPVRRLQITFIIIIIVVVIVIIITIIIDADY
jgi:hypothetical protein